MSHRNTSNLTRTCLLVLFTLFFSVSQLFAQTTIGRQKVDQFYTGPWTTPFYGLTWLPSDYYSNSNTYPLIIFLHGTGEAGTGVSGLYNLLHHSLPLTIANGWDPKAVNPADGKTYQFIVVSPQAPVWSCNYDNLSYILPDIMSKYRIDPARVYVTGVSAGGAGTWSSVTNGSTFAQKFAAVVPVSAAGTNTPYEANQIPLVGGTYGDKVWNICGTGDAFWSSATNFTNQINSANPAPSVPAALSGLPGGHDASVWNTAYDPNWRSNEQNLNVYEWMLKYTRGNSTSTPSGSTPTAPAATTISLTNITRIEAEAFSSQNGVQTEGTSDAGGGQNVGYIDNGDWMDYPVNVTTSGTYTVSFRVASQATGGQLQLKKSDGTVLTTVSVPNTGGWQTWQTVMAQVPLSAGTQTLRITSTASAGWNINWVEYTGLSGAPLPTTPTTSSVALPGKVEAEAYTSQNGTQTENTSDAGGGQNLGYIDNGDWMDYSVNPSTSGTYTVNFRVASQASGAQLQLRKTDGTTLATVSVPNTGGWQTWQTVSAVVNLSAGAQTLRVVSTASAGWNINYIDFASGGSTTNTTPTTPTTSTSSRIEAESFTNQSGTQTEGTSDAGGGQDVGYIDNGDWMDYSVNPSTSGTYTVNFRVATQSSGGQFQLRKADGTTLATVSVPNTGGWQTWQTVSAVVTLSAGQQTLRIASTASPNWNINWFEMAAGGTTSGTTTTTASSQRVEAETFSSQSGTQTEGTSDAGGGQDVGYIDNGDWMDYSVNVPSSATYTVNFRVATQSSGGQFQLRKADGTVLATVSVPNTGGWQTWQTVSANVTLAAGQQTLRIVSTASPNWNINWFELASGSSATAALSTTAVTESTTTTTTSMTVYPNPVVDKFVLDVNNNLTGSLKAQLYDMNGTLQKEFSLTKNTTGSVQFYLSIGTLPAGTYILKASMTGWSDSTQVVKQ